ncbi:hypothetical protein BOX15_Mlig028230g1 [Macrostomum lignano]|uniref:Uncharacterized protein n=1 Tax=Macrostomum lignano TaxID=282301 RepID=A0A267GK91_9PLAT|nr:hypothetical protein BOX15_Mlig028230g1 [Macrostomum lignano]
MPFNFPCRARDLFPVDLGIDLKAMQPEILQCKRRFQQDLWNTICNRVLQEQSNWKDEKDDNEKGSEKGSEKGNEKGNGDGSGDSGKSKEKRKESKVEQKKKEEKSEEKSEEKAEENSEEKMEEKSEEKMEEKYEEKTEEKYEENYEEKTEERVEESGEGFRRGSERPEGESEGDGGGGGGGEGEGEGNENNAMRAANRSNARRALQQRSTKSRTQQQQQQQQRKPATATRPRLLPSASKQHQEQQQQKPKQLQQQPPQRRSRGFNEGLQQQLPLPRRYGIASGGGSGGGGELSNFLRRIQPLEGVLDWRGGSSGSRARFATDATQPPPPPPATVLPPVLAHVTPAGATARSYSATSRREILGFADDVNEEDEDDGAASLEASEMVHEVQLFQSNSFAAAEAPRIGTFYSDLDTDSYYLNRDRVDGATTDSADKANAFVPLFVGSWWACGGQRSFQI